MPTRRAFAGLTAGALLGLMRSHVDARAELRSGSRETPQGACDCHVHVVGDPAVFPMDPNRDYTPQPATAVDLERHLASLGVERAIVVTPTIYGTDASATLAAIAYLGKRRACGAVFVGFEAPRRHLERLSEGGVVSMRLFLTDGESFDREHALQKLRSATAMAQALGWSLQIAAPPAAIEACAQELQASPTPIVLDAFGWLAGGVDQPGFETIRALVSSGVGYVKLAQPYKISANAPDYGDVTQVAAALVEANPDRVIWGSGWPHVRSDPGAEPRTEPLPPLPIDSGHMLDLLDVWAPSPAVRRRILVDNPARLFGFRS